MGVDNKYGWPGGSGGASSAFGTITNLTGTTITVQLTDAFELVKGARIAFAITQDVVDSITNEIVPASINLIDNTATTLGNFVLLANGLGSTMNSTITRQIPWLPKISNFGGVPPVDTILEFLYVGSWPSNNAFVLTNLDFIAAAASINATNNINRTSLLLQSSGYWAISTLNGALWQLTVSAIGFDTVTTATLTETVSKISFIAPSNNSNSARIQILGVNYVLYKPVGNGYSPLGLNNIKQGSVVTIQYSVEDAIWVVVSPIRRGSTIRTISTSQSGLNINGVYSYDDELIIVDGAGITVNLNWDTDNSIAVGAEYFVLPRTNITTLTLTFGGTCLMGDGTEATGATAISDRNVLIGLRKVANNLWICTRT